MADEIELKLELTRADAERLAASTILPDAPAIADQHAIYFDTPDRRLQAAGFSLRIRRTGDRRVQTVKATGTQAAGLFARPEWEFEVADDEPVLDLRTPLSAMLGDVAVEPVFVVAVERRTWVIREADAVIEVVLDRGKVLAADRETSICELELELKAGDPSALFALARAMAAIAPLRLGVLTKSERGYRLLDKAVTVQKAEPVVLVLDMTAGEAFQAIAAACLRQFRLNEAAILDARDDEALHQARVALRRLRSAFIIFKPVVTDERMTDLGRELRWLASLLGKARDLDVLIARAGRGAWGERLLEARVAAYDAAVEALASDRVRGLMLDLVEWLAGGSWLHAAETGEVRAAPAREFAASALGRFRRKVKRKGKALESLDDESRHEVRKDAKKLRYAAEFFATLFPKKQAQRRHAQFVAALSKLQDHLGDLNDLASAPATLEELGLTDDPHVADLIGRARKSKLLRKASEAHDAFADAKRFWS